MFAMLKVATNLLLISYGAVLIAMVSSIPSLTTNSWQHRLYAVTLDGLLLGLLPTFFLAVMTGYSTSNVEDWIKTKQVTNPIFIALYLWIALFMAALSSLSLSYNLGALQGFVWQSLTSS